MTHANDNPSREELDALAKEIKEDQAKATNTAKKRVKVDMSFKKAVKKMAQTPPPKKKDK